MRNRYAGECYRCGGRVDPGSGHFERSRGGWRTIHAGCAIEQRAEKAKARKARARVEAWKPEEAGDE